MPVKKTASANCVVVKTREVAWEMGAAAAAAAAAVGGGSHGSTSGRGHGGSLLKPSGKVAQR